MGEGMKGKSVRKEGNRRKRENQSHTHFPFPTDRHYNNR